VRPKSIPDDQQKQLAQFVQVFTRHHCRTASRAHLAQALDAVILQVAEPAIYRLPRCTNGSGYLGGALSFNSRRPARTRRLAASSTFTAMAYSGCHSNIAIIRAKAVITHAVM
jgi:hypothetical protein